MPAATQPSRDASGLPRLVLILLAVAAGWLAISAIQGLKEIVAPVFLALNLMIAVHPLKRRLTKARVPEWLASVVAGLVVLLILVGFFYALGWAVAALVRELPHYRPEFDGLYHRALDQLSRLGISQDQLQQGLQGIDPGSLMGVAQSALSGAGNVAQLLVMIVTVLVFLMMDAIGFSDRLKIARDHESAFVDALETFALGVRKYWVVSTIFGLIVAVLDLGVLLVLGVPLALAWGVLAFVTNYIPNVGFVLGLVPPVLMALLAKGPGAAIIVAIAYCVLNFVIQSIIQPKFAGDAVGVTPTVSVLSLFFWAWVMGALGAILALPATLLVKAVLVDADPKMRWLNAFIAAQPHHANPAAASAVRRSPRGK